ncbi:hypothetical protein RB608_09315 [Nocardioides sp. LHD-245]|uniref:hypothetical protein n=1 Tax=Nocardioides sp. LHD-245 TaxID=3051387 RepID=UPI0027DF107E|nr:hypothetical protein [Nocardioides sp. LHD-245]
MTWNIHERLRIIRVVEAVAAVDMSGALPWREEWRAHFDGPVGLVAALRSHWQDRSPVPPESEIDENREVDVRMRRTEIAVREILRRYDAGDPVAPVLLSLAEPRPATLLPQVARPRRRRPRRYQGLHRGSVLD